MRVKEAKVVVARRFRATSLGTVARIPVGSIPGELAAIALMCPILLGVALWNGFPITFFDTGAYMLQGLGRFFLPERSAVYSLFLRYAGGRETLWLVVTAQAAICSFVIVEFARAEARHLSAALLIAMMSAMIFLTGIAWYVGQIEPDCFTGILVLSLWLLAFRTREIGAIRGALVLAAGAFAIAAHPSHLGLAAGLVLAFALARGAAVYVAPLPRPQLTGPSLAVVLGFVIAFGANYSLTHQFFFSRSGSVFLLARFMENGTLKPYLDAVCPQAHYRLCEYKDDLPAKADDYLWEEGSIFTKLGRFRGTARESEAIVNGVIAYEPGRVALNALKNGAVQSGYFLTGDGIEPQEWVLNTEFERFIPHQFRAYTAARQQRGQLDFMSVNIVHVTIALISMAGLAWLIREAVRRRRWHRAALPVVVGVALLGNALICGALSGPHARYQSRIIWLPTLVLALALRPKPAFSLRRHVESGT